MSDTDFLTGGFADPAADAARAFRAILDAMARPGRIVRVTGGHAPRPASVAMASVLLTLADGTTPVHLAGAYDDAHLRDWLRFHTGAPALPRDAAVFAAGRWQDLLPLDDFPQGSAEYPDQSATLIVELDRLQAEGHRLSGPGIETTARLSLPDVALFVQNSARFPLGVDFIFTCGDRLAALPRTTHVEAA